ncbi:SulP family inorganic anion transporter [Clostridium aminobutyricum]|uniref:SulP family inorganic anion transporter n=1 Tax=Clostridium aminobutyricum TaxID=33953 RepID=A0A939D5V1_CLOAM|nr:SulP family inorganic anion transporter [Clostridium aminobutyricum]MBN7771954.1 SulP family inorganic anion transporter [Clostridium aminobutyricum]
MNLITIFAEDLKNEFKGYNLNGFSKDLMAGMTVAAVALPLAIAFGVGSGATAAAGLVTAIIGGIVIGTFSGASFQISGPTGAMTAILVTLSAKYGMQGILIACFLAGVMLVAAGILRLGRMIYFIPASVITGFTSGIAIIIALGQLDNLFRVKSTGDLAITKVLSYFTEGFSPDLPTAFIGFLVMILMIIWPKKWNEKIPSSLAALVIILILNYYLKLDVAVVGDIPKTILLDDRLTFDSLKSGQIWDFFIPALSIAALAMIESLLCGASAGKMKNEKLNGDRELIAQGIGNMVIPLFGGVPATAAIARTSVGIKAGAGTRVTSIIHSVILLLSMFILAPVMSAIPLSALSGVLIVTAWRMNDWENIHFIFDHKFKSGIAKFFITMGATVVLDLTQAIIIGVAFSSILIMVRLTDIDINLSDIDNKRLEEIGIFIPKISSKVRIAYLTGTIFFAVVDKIVNQLSELENTKVLILSMRGVPVIDVTGVQGLIELIKTLREHGIEVMFTSVQPKVLKKMQRGGIVELVGEANIFRSAEEAIIIAHTHI